MLWLMVSIPPTYAQTTSKLELQDDFDTTSENGTNKSPTSYTNYNCDVAEAGNEQNQACSPPVTMEPRPPPFHTLILDLAGVCFVDLMGIKVLTKVGLLNHAALFQRKTIFKKYHVIFSTRVASKKQKLRGRICQSFLSCQRFSHICTEQ